MRKMFLLMLLASASVPAIAGPGDNENRGPRGHRAEKSQSDSDSPKPERPARPERSYQPQQQQQHQNEVARPDADNRHTFRDTMNSSEPQSNAGEARVRKVERPTLPDRPQAETPSIPMEARVRKSTLR